MELSFHDERLPINLDIDKRQILNRERIWATDIAVCRNSEGV